MSHERKQHIVFGDVPSAWQIAKLKDITTKIGSGATPRGGDSVYLPQRETYALVRSQNVFDHYFDETGLAFISDDDAQKLSNVFLQPGEGVSRNWCKWPQVIKTISDPRNEWRAGSKSAAS